MDRDRMEMDRDRMDDLLPDLGLLTSDDCNLGTAGPNDPPAGQYLSRMFLDGDSDTLRQMQN